MKSRKLGVPEWVHEEWKNLDRRETLYLSLVEALKAHGTQASAEIRKQVKAG